MKITGIMRSKICIRAAFEIELPTPDANLCWCMRRLAVVSMHRRDVGALCASFVGCYLLRIGVLFRDRWELFVWFCCFSLAN
jgi:hypothetical protein